MVKEKVKIKTKAKVLPKKAAILKVVQPKQKVVKAKFEYFEGTGRRKTAIARIRLFPGEKSEFLVNNKDYQQYFPTALLRHMAKASLEAINYQGEMAISALVRGGGVSAQAEAVRLGISRAFLKFSPDSDKKLKKLGYLTRDPRMRERKKPGLKRARKAPQWQKR